MNNLYGFFRFNEVEIENEIKLTKEAISEASSDLRRLQCLCSYQKMKRRKLKMKRFKSNGKKMARYGLKGHSLYSSHVYRGGVRR